MAYRTSKPLHPTEFGEPKRTVTKKKQVYIDTHLGGKEKSRGSVETRTKKIIKKGGRTITKTKAIETNVNKSNGSYSSTPTKRNVVRKTKEVVKGKRGGYGQKTKESVRSKGKIGAYKRSKLKSK